MAEPRPEFIQISTFGALRELRAYTFVRPVNCYKKRKDKRGAFLIRLGWRDGDHYSGHRYIVRCMTGPLLGEAEAIVREKLGMPPRVVAE